MNASVWRFLLALAVASACWFPALGAADTIETVARVKRSIVAVGTFEPTRSPPFQFRGSGFAVDDGSLIATNAHVLPEMLAPSGMEKIVVLLSSTAGDERSDVREVKRAAVDQNSDLALLRLTGPPVPPLELRDSDTVREGQEILLTGYPIGAVLGPFPATHRGIISAITPIAIPQGRGADLNAAVVRRLAHGSYPVFQLDATAYPGNSGSPIYDPLSGQVLGIVNMVLVKGTKEAALTQPSGITYAVPARHLRALIKTLR